MFDDFSKWPFDNAYGEWMFDNYLLTAVIVWCLTGGIGNLIAFWNCCVMYERYRQENLKRIKNQNALLTWAGACELAPIEHWQMWLVIGNVLAFFGSAIWFIGLPLVVMIAVFLALTVVYEYCKEIIYEHYQEKNYVIRILKKKPHLIEEIIAKGEGKYFDIAQELVKAGTIVINKHTGYVEIEGKKYKVKFE